jgi:hypothetical protein
MDASLDAGLGVSLGLTTFTFLFLAGTFFAALVAGLGGFAFGIVAAAIWLYIPPRCRPRH